MESHPAVKNMGIFRTLRFASLGDTPKNLTKGERRVAPSPPEDRLPKKGEGGISPTYAAATRGQTPKKDGEWQLVEKKKRNEIKKEKKKKEVPVPSAQCVQYREMEHLHRGDGAEKGSRLPVTNDR